MRGKHITGAPGKEWFQSSVQEVIEVIEFAGASAAQAMGASMSAS
jgi:hypothetical protein